MRTVRAVLLRDLRVARSYPLSFVVQNVSVLLTLLTTRFLAELFNGAAPGALAGYGGDYFSFALLGVAIANLSYPAVKTLAGAVRGAQVTGTFEAMLTTRGNPVVIILSSAVYPLARALLEMTLLLVIGVVALGARFDLANLALVWGVLALLLAALLGVGLASAAFTIAFKQAEPLSSAVLAATLVLSGVAYPTAVLPDWLRLFAPLLPATHAIELTRDLLLSGRASGGTLAVHAVALAGFALLLPAGMLLLSLALDYARRAGSLAHY
jgi:ABC-2 type transport system permease protein